MKEGKNFKIWGFSYGLIGDLIMALPQLIYMEKKYPESYKYWVIEKKVSQCAPLFFNHPLIDKIIITEDWETFGPSDYELMKQCDIVLPRNSTHNPSDWYNHYNCIEETARLVKINDLKDNLTPDELEPKLYKWFSSYTIDPRNDGYSKRFTPEQQYKRITIWPFPGYNRELGKTRSPTPEWWSDLILLLINQDYLVDHCGYYAEPILSRHPNYTNRTKLSFFDQIRVSLDSTVVIGADSGAIWCIGAYQHPTISILKSWAPNHTKNLTAFAPINKNGKILFFDKNTQANILNIIQNYEQIRTN